MAENTLYRGTLKTTDVVTSSTVTLVKGQYVTIGELKVQADECVGMGYGAYNSQDQADGRIYVSLYDNTATTPVAITGKFRIMTMTSQNIPCGSKPVYLDVDLSALSQGSSDRRAQIAFPFSGEMLTKDKKFVFQVCNDAASAQTLSQANSTVLMDITRQLV